jgi:hypothetical protein
LFLFCSNSSRGEFGDRNEFKGSLKDGTTMMIASRTLTLRGADGDAAVEVRIARPEQDDADFRCTFEIDWPDGREAHTIFGADAVQALVLALQTIGSRIYSSDEHRSGRLFFDEPGGGYGFPVPHTMRELLIGNDRTSF